MKRFNHLISFFTFVVLLLLVWPSNGYAYLDPGAGSYVFQVIMATIIGGVFAIKLYWVKLKKLFRNLFKRG